MYKKTMENQQRRADAIPAHALPSLPSDRTDVEKREDIRARLRQIEVQIAAAKAADNKEARHAFIDEKRRLEAELAALRIECADLKADLGELLIDELRQMLTKPQYQIAIKNAEKRFVAGETKNDMNLKRGRP